MPFKFRIQCITRLTGTYTNITVSSTSRVYSLLSDAITEDDDHLPYASTPFMYVVYRNTENSSPGLYARNGRHIPVNAYRFKIGTQLLKQLRIVKVKDYVLPPPLLGRCECVFVFGGGIVFARVVCLSACLMFPPFGAYTRCVQKIRGQG